MRHSSQPSAPGVLIADDQASYRELLRQMLAGISGAIFECADGDEAVACFEMHRPDWALLDWSMPGLDGLCAAREIRARHPHAQIVIFSAHLTPILEREAAAAGVRGCFRKECLNEVVALVRASFSNRKEDAPD